MLAMKSPKYFALCWLLLCLVCAECECNYERHSVQYNIIPSSNIPCPQDPCLTISQFAAANTSIEHNVSLSLFFLPGNHSLDRVLHLTDIDYISVTKDTNTSVIIECPGPSGRFVFNNISYALIHGIHFIGCGGNTVTQVKEFVVKDTTFQGVEGGGTALVLNNLRSTKIARCQFLSNTHSHFKHDRDLQLVLRYLLQEFGDIDSETISIGGAFYSVFSNISVEGTVFEGNSAELFGVAITAENSSILISQCHFINNKAGNNTAVHPIGFGMIFSYGSDIFVNSSKFIDNSVAVGGALLVYYSSLYIRSSSFINNCATQYGGVIGTKLSLCNIINSIFIDNIAAQHGGVIYSRESYFNITGSTFTNNSASKDGGVMAVSSSSFVLFNNSFTSNSAEKYGGVIQAERSYFIDIISSAFYDNTAQYGGVISAFDSSLSVHHSHFSFNSAQFYGGIMCIFQSSSRIFSSIFDHNSGSLYIFYSDLYFYGFTSFINCTEPPNKGPIGDILIYQEGGAITSFFSHINFSDGVSLSNNEARNGGAMLATESAILLFEDSVTMFTYNRAINGSGGGVSLHQSSLLILGDCTVSNNYAVHGGGIHASGSFVTAYQHGQLGLINNSAKYGGGIYLKGNSELYLVKVSEPTSKTEDIIMMFSANSATYGGAVFVADDTITGTCLPREECFFQTVAIYLQSSLGKDLKTVNIIFSENTAEYGSSLYGGLLDRCIPSPLAEVYHKHNIINNGITYLGNISNITLDTVSSPPVRVCFCTSEGEPDCEYRLPLIRVKKGETFTVPLVAVDQVNHSISANISASTDGGLGEGQQNQEVERMCTDLTFNLFSSVDSEIITLFANGPCGNSPLSTRQINIQFLKCTCPIGFEPSSKKISTCECNCDSKLFPHITTGNATTNSLLRVNTNSWISYTNDTHPQGYIIHPFCPVGYCHPPSVIVQLDLNIPNGADAQCAYNRTGVLCGACQENLSLSLGSSRCVSCYSHWPVVFVITLLAAFIAGVLLVTLLLFLNMTVAIGLINSFIFYANLVAASSTIFFPSLEPSYPKVFVTWLNLDIGLDMCFFDGLDEYTKVWLQLAFPLYLISLIIAIIALSKYSSRFAGLIGKKDPIATLATLILLSYSKLLSIIITALGFAVLRYPDGSKQRVWLSDGNVKYFQGKHIALVIMALCIILIGVPYTAVLFLRQWIPWTPRWRIIRWTNITKFNHFISTYHLPYHSKYRYWTSLLLLVRITVYFTASISASSNPHTSVVVTSIFVGGLFFLSRISGVRVYQKSVVDVVNTVLYSNLLIFAVLSLYHVKEDTIKQTVVAYISVSITFILLVGVIVYHVALLRKKDNASDEVIMNEYTLSPAPAQSANSDHEERVTYSIVDLPKTASSESETSNENFENAEECRSSYL